VQDPDFMDGAKAKAHLTLLYRDQAQLL